MSAAQSSEAAGELVKRSTLSSGVPIRVEDKTTLTRVVDVMRGALGDENDGREMRECDDDLDGPRRAARSPVGMVVVKGEDLVCGWCRVSLVGLRSDAKFCSSACRQAAYRSRRVTAIRSLSGAGEEA